ncbi:MAG: methyltransferase domain-containing protein [Bacteroidia bacterium]|nr:methyltransferase domain-containing protein [Bacteroidia bacterium]
MKNRVLIVRTLHGIEAITARDIRISLQSEPFSSTHREVWVRSEETDVEKLRLGSADDVFALVEVLQNLDHTRKSLVSLAEGFSTGMVTSFAEEFRQWRNIAPQPRFTVVASFLGKRNYNRYEIEDHIGKSFAEKTGWFYIKSNEGATYSPPLTFRVHLWENKAWLGLRIFETPLHRRDYKQFSRIGTLHPPLAYAMAMLADPAPGDQVLDPFCGAGTIPIETQRYSPQSRIFASDYHPEQVQQTQENALLAGISLETTCADAGALPYPDFSFDRIITNMPWDYTVAATGKLSAGPEPFWLEMNRLLKPGGKAVILTHEQNQHIPRLEELGFKIESQTIVSLFGRHPEIWLISRANYV